MPALKQSNPPLVLCFGEILWDSLPQGMFAGGAPINVAYHLKQHGARAIPVTAVGRDVLGEELLRRLRLWRLETDFVTVVEGKSTGLVRVEVNASGIPSYEIVEDVAWDWIQVSEPLIALASHAAALVFGSLAQRSEHNRRELHRLRQACARGLKVFDINLRSPFDSADLVWELAAGVDLIKLNDQEIRSLLGRSADETLESAARDLADRTGCDRVCITAGPNGAGLLSDGKWYWAESRPVAVKDTVGAGDSFLAALISGLLAKPFRGEQAVLERACRLAEFVAGSEGATPSYPPELRQPLG